MGIVWALDAISYRVNMHSDYIKPDLKGHA